MTDVIRARELQVTNYQTMAVDAQVSDVRRALVELQATPERPAALVIVDDRGNYVGFVTARLLLKSLLALWAPQKSVRDDPELLDRHLLDVVQARSDIRIGDALVQGLPTATPETRLLPLIEMACEAQLEFIPVLDAGKATGLVPLTRLFAATAKLVLTPGDEGIRSDGQNFT
ncbi:MAG: hypothetical protein AAF581_21735 [Planctomycetota bacterium]